MTTTVARAAPVVGPRRSTLTGTWTLVRLALRRDRIQLLVWILGIGAVAASTFAAFAQLYPNEAERQALAAGIALNPAFLALTGPVASTSLGGLTAWRIGVLGTTLIGLMALVTVVRHTRADEETGRSELLASGVVGRVAPLASAVVVATGASLVIGLIVAAAGIGLGEPAAGSVLLGASLAAAGFVLASVAAVTAQLVENARTATALAAAVLAVGFLLRAVADVEHSVSWLGWISPQGLGQRVHPFADNDVLPLLISVLAGAVLLGVAARMLDRRDLGLALLPSRRGPATNPRLRSAWSLTTRLHRGTLVGWLVGIGVFGAVIGGIAASAGDLLSSNPQVAQVLAQMGGTGNVTNLFITAFCGIAGLVAGAYAISAALRMSAEENADRVGPVLATAVPRRRWMTSHLVFVALGPTLMLATGGLVAGLVHGARISSVGEGLQATLSGMLVQLPAVWVMGGIAAALYGWLPRWTPVAWAAMVTALLLGQLGPLLQLPQWLLDVSPYAHLPAVPAEPMAWGPCIALTVLAAGLTVLALTGFARRDVQ